MVFARESRGGSAGLPNHGVSAVSADIVESTELHILAQNDKERNPGHFKGMVISDFIEPAAVRDVQPRLEGISSIGLDSDFDQTHLAEECSFFQLEDFVLRHVHRSLQTSLLCLI